MKSIKTYNLWLILGLLALTGAIALIITRVQIAHERKSRLKNSVNVIQAEIASHVSHSGSLTVEMDRRVLHELSRSDPYALTTARIAVAWLSLDGHRLSVSWIADKANADGIALINQVGDRIMKVSIPTFYFSEFAKEEQQGVLYDVVVNVDSSTNGKEEIKSLNWTTIRAALLRGEKQISLPADIVIPVKRESLKSPESGIAPRNCHAEVSESSASVGK